MYQNYDQKISWGKINWHILQYFHFFTFYFCNKGDSQKTKNMHYYLLAPYKGDWVGWCSGHCLHPGSLYESLLGNLPMCALVFYTLLHGDSPQQFMCGITTSLPSKGMFSYCGYWTVILSRFLSMLADGKLKAQFIAHTHSQKLSLRPYSWLCFMPAFLVFFLLLLLWPLLGYLYLLSLLKSFLG